MEIASFIEFTSFMSYLNYIWLALCVCVFRFPILNSIKHAIATSENPWKKNFLFSFEALCNVWKRIETER